MTDHKPQLLEVDDLRVEFRTPDGIARAVDGVSFLVRPGETLGLAGESGCGKSVTALSLLRLVPEPGVITAGSIRLGGREVLHLADEDLRRLRGGEAAMVFQEPMTALNPVYSVGDQVAEVLRAHADLTRREAASRAVELLAQVGLSDPAKRAREYPHHLSGGMRQRVVIAMAMAGEPRLLIADEPTTALDVTIQAQILDLLADLREHRGLGVLLITHDLGVVAQHADRVAIMYAGRIVEQAAVEALFRAPAHPYTEGLLRSRPDLTAPGEPLAAIEGTVPSPFDTPSGCRYRTRCPRAAERCAAEEPSLVARTGTGGGHTVACHFPAEHSTP